MSDGTIARVRRRLKREHFQPSWLGVIVNPAYLIRRALFRGVARAAPDLRGAVMDLGCGSKPYEDLFVNATSYIGVDIAVSGHDHATSKVDVFYDGTTLPFENARFDAVVAFEVFEHVFNLPDLLAEVRRVIRPGGTLLFTIPFAWEEHEQPYDFARYTQFGIRSILSGASFDDIHVVKSNTNIEAIAQVFIVYLQDHVFPRNTFLRRILQLAIVVPMIAATLLAKHILPRADTYYSNLIVTATKR